MSLTRRSLLKASLAALPAYYAGWVFGQTRPATSGDIDPGNLPPILDGLFKASDVRLLPGSPFYERQELHRRKTLAAYEPDKLLYPYRAQAGLPQADGVRGGYAGWDTGFIRGHMTGHYLSAASRMAAATGDKIFADRVNYIVGELARCQEALKLDGYLAAFSTVAFDNLEGKRGNAGGIVVPYYTIHKIMSGLLDAHHYLGNAQALQVAEKMAAYFEKRLAALEPAQIERLFRTDGNRNPQNEFGAMSDVLTELYKTTRNVRYLKTARIFNRPWFLDPLARGEDHLGGLHANTHIAQAIGIANTANADGNPLARLASENFWRLVTHDHSFVNGGNSFKEWFDKPGVEVGTSIDGNAELPATTCETCNTHNMLRLTARLFERQPTAEYADYYERALYNHLLASVAPDTGEMTYFMPLRGRFRTYMNGTFCCTGTGIENTPRYNEGIYYRQKDALWINLYIPSEVTWLDAGLVLRQGGDITKGEPVRITIVSASANPASLNIRIPHWISRPATIAVNGTVEATEAKASTYATLKRPWKAGDVITLTLPLSLRLEKAKDDASMIAVFYGPLLLAGELGREGMPNDFADKDAHIRTPPAAVPDIETPSASPADWLQPLPGETLAFKAGNVGAANGIVFRPIYQVHHERYSIYWRLRPAKPA
jgi:DUF1680 family protein